MGEWITWWTRRSSHTSRAAFSWFSSLSDWSLSSYRSNFSVHSISTSLTNIALLADFSGDASQARLSFSSLSVKT